MNIKKYGVPALVLTTALATAACSDARGLKNIQNYHGDGAEVVAIPDTRYKFIARKADGSVWYGVSAGFNDDSISHVQLLPPTNK